MKRFFLVFALALGLMGGGFFDDVKAEGANPPKVAWGSGVAPKVAWGSGKAPKVAWGSGLRLRVAWGSRAPS